MPFDLSRSKPVGKSSKGFGTWDSWKGKTVKGEMALASIADEPDDANWQEILRKELGKAETKIDGDLIDQFSRLSPGISSLPLKFRALSPTQGIRAS